MVATSILDAAEAHRVGLVDVVVPRESFEDQWRAVARKLETLPVGEIERVIPRASAPEAVAAFARLWESDEHWAAADRVTNRKRSG